MLKKSAFWNAKCNVTQKNDKNGLAASLNQLGTFYCTGVGCSRDYVKGIPLLQEAAKLGNKEAEFRLAHHLLMGIGVAMDCTAGFQILENLALVKNYENAQSLVGAIGVVGAFGIPRNTKYLECIKKVAAQKNGPVEQALLQNSEKLNEDDVRAMVINYLQQKPKVTVPPKIQVLMDGNDNEEDE